MPPAPPQGNQDSSSGMLWGIAALFVALGVIWVTLKRQIVVGYLTIKLFEIKFLSLFNEFYFASVQSSILSAMADPQKVTFNELVSLGAVAGEWVRYPFMIFLIALAVVVYFGNSTRSFKRTYNMRDLAKLEKDNWPQISPVLNLNLEKTDIDSGPWAMAMTPIQFCKRYKLLEEVRPQRREGMSRKEWDRVEVVLKRGEANKLFALQLGPLWRGIDKLPPHTRALFAVFAARINADTSAAAELLYTLNVSAATKLNISGANELIKKHEKTKLVQQIIHSHAYVLTVMAAMLEAARADGVQASADFLWLKPLDRRLWYTLNTVGRQTPFAEVSGIFAHWLAEKEAGRKLLVPVVEEATKALEIALKEVVYRPDDT
ncbi:MAG: phosphoesterase [Gammaproteobacteria bacterium]|nr:MAG: phosphoesterase [Gammaproteobacteria bacterium]